MSDNELYGTQMRLARKILLGFLNNLPNAVGSEITGSVFLAGGAIHSIITNDVVNDYDIYFTNVKALNAYMKFLERKYDDFVWDPRYIYRKDGDKTGKVQSFLTFEEREDLVFQGVNNVAYIENSDDFYSSENAITFPDGYQVIFRFVGEPETIVNNFDFAHCTGYIKLEKDIDAPVNFVLPELMKKTILGKQLVVQGTKYPLDSLVRMKKYISRGYTIDAVETMKLAFAVNKLDLNDMIVLRDQMIGIDAHYLRKMVSMIDDMINDGDKFVCDEFILEIMRESFDEEVLNKGFRNE